MTPSFEIAKLKNESGRVFAAGVSTLGAHYAPVDSFLGLQCAALASVEALHPYVPRLTPTTSLAQWFRWLGGLAP